MQLDNKDIIKLIGFVAVTVSMWYDLKTDLQVHIAVTELRLNALENPKQPKSVASYQHMAIMPEETKLEND